MELTDWYKNSKAKTNLEAAYRAVGYDNPGFLAGAMFTLGNGGIANYLSCMLVNFNRKETSPTAAPQDEILFPANRLGVNNQIVDGSWRGGEAIAVDTPILTLSNNEVVVRNNMEIVANIFFKRRKQLIEKEVVLAAIDCFLKDEDVNVFIDGKIAECAAEDNDKKAELEKLKAAFIDTGPAIKTFGRRVEVTLDEIDAKEKEDAAKKTVVAEKTAVVKDDNKKIEMPKVKCQSARGEKSTSWAEFVENRQQCQSARGVTSVLF